MPLPTAMTTRRSQCQTTELLCRLSVIEPTHSHTYLFFFYFTSWISVGILWSPCGSSFTSRIPKELVSLSNLSSPCNNKSFATNGMICLTSLWLGTPRGRILNFNTYRDTSVSIHNNLSENKFQWIIKYILQGAGKLRSGGNWKVEVWWKFNPAIPQLPPALCLDLQTGIYV